MKWAIIIPDGCADLPVDALQGKTSLQAANIPAIRQIAQQGIVGATNNTPLHFPAGSEVANMVLFGYDPDQYFTGRAPIEAAAQGIQLGPHDWAVRCNLVTIENQTMIDFTADHISTAEAAELLDACQQSMGSDQWKFVTGVSYRNLLLYRGNEQLKPPFSEHTRTRAPHDITDQTVLDEYPRGTGADILTKMMEASVAIFKDHPVNKKRIAAGKRPATNLWLWGLGRGPQLPSFHSRFGIRGAMITAVDLLRGIAALVGWDRIEVPGATGYLDTDYAAKGRYAVEALKTYDIVCVHVEATDEASHEGRVDEKIKALEAIDRDIVAPVHAALKQYGDYRILVLPDHPTPVTTKKHSHGNVPLAICGKDVAVGGIATYDEPTAATSSIQFPQGWKMMEQFIQGKL
jgi:2,3-bisphosphoglycerate-independent phosphoglycerate mutase